MLVSSSSPLTPRCTSIMLSLLFPPSAGYPPSSRLITSCFSPQPHPSFSLPVTPMASSPLNGSISILLAQHLAASHPLLCPAMHPLLGMTTAPHKGPFTSPCTPRQRPLDFQLLDAPSTASIQIACCLCASVSAYLPCFPFSSCSAPASAPSCTAAVAQRRLVLGADAIVDQLDACRGREDRRRKAATKEDAERMSAAVWGAMWSEERLKQREFFLFGQSVLLKLDLQVTLIRCCCACCVQVRLVPVDGVGDSRPTRKTRSSPRGR